MYQWLKRFALLGMTFSTAFAVEYVQQKPMSDVIITKVQDCSSDEPVLPVITWGGDIATIYANGNDYKTKEDSIFGKQGLKFNIKRIDDFKEQVKNYMSCKSPFLRGTMGMLNMASSVTENDSRTKMVIVYQLTWSQGADALVVKGNINKAKDLKGKTIVVQSYGPHIDYLLRVLSDAGLKENDVKIKYVKDLTGTNQSPSEAFKDSDVDAAMMISPDASALTSGGTVGTGGEGSIKGAKILLSTKSANTIISDVYAVRSDYFKENKDLVFKMVKGLIESQNEVVNLFKKKSNKEMYNKIISSSGKILLDSEHASDDVVGMFEEAKFVGLSGNEDFFTSKSYPRRLTKIQEEIQSAYVSYGFLNNKNKISTASWEYKDFKLGKLSQVAVEDKPMFNSKKVDELVKKKVATGTLSEGELFSFDIFFSPSQSAFPASEYKRDFEKAIDLAMTYGGAIVTVEGHVDQMEYLTSKFGSKTRGLEPQSVLVLNRVKQSAKNLSLARSNAVKDSLLNYAKQNGVNLDISKFSTVGHGITCEDKSCAPQTKQEWAEQRRVKFRIIQVESEAQTFNPLD